MTPNATSRSDNTATPSAASDEPMSANTATSHHSERNTDMSTTLQTIIEIAIRYGRATTCTCYNCRMQARIIETELAEAIRAFALENPNKPY